MSVRWVPTPLTGAAGRVDTQAGNASTPIPGRFGGYTIRNNDTVSVQVDIYDNASAASGTLLATMDLTAKGTVGACQTVMYDDRGIVFEHGVYVNPSVVSQIVGSVFLG